MTGATTATRRSRDAATRPPRISATRASATAAIATRLVEASRRKSFDPFNDIDWSIAIDDSAFHIPPEFLPLYGTRQWKEMSRRERITYSRHECAALCATGIWLENILMRLVLRHLYAAPADNAAHRYLLVEVADECRHSAMFGEYIRRAGTPAYRPHRLLRLAGGLMLATADTTAGFISILAAEEVLDVNNRAMMSTPAIHPVAATMARIHVIEEARHVAFARTYLRDEWPRLDRLARSRGALLAPIYVKGTVESLTNPAVYRELGIRGGWRAARSNPHHRQRVAGDLRRLTDLLAELGVINRWTRPAWNALGLLPAS
jgi:hypothetical protein